MTTTAKRPDAVTHLLDSRRGIYIPRDFCEDFNITMWNLDPESWEVQTCLAGPDVEDYWDAWEQILSHAEYRHGPDAWFLHQDGDLWALCYERMSDEEKAAFAFEADE
jgi:hypothetical protein